MIRTGTPPPLFFTEGGGGVVEFKTIVHDTTFLVRFSELENQQNKTNLLLFPFSGYLLNPRIVAPLLQVAELYDNLKLSSTIFHWNGDLISLRNYQQIHSIKSFLEVCGIFSRTTTTATRPLNRKKFAKSSMSAAKVIKAVWTRPFRNELVRNSLLKGDNKRHVYLYHPWFLRYEPSFFRSSFTLFTPYNRPVKAFRVRRHLEESSEFFTHSLVRVNRRSKRDRRTFIAGGKHSLEDSRFLRRKSFLNLVSTLTRKVRVVSHNAGFIFMSRPFIRPTGILDAFGDVQKLNYRAERKLSPFPLGLRPLSFLNRFDLRKVNITNISPVKSGMLLAFYDAYQVGHNTRLNVSNNYNPLPSQHYYDYRVRILRFGGFENLFWLNNFKQFPQNFFRFFVGASGQRVMVPRVWSENKPDLRGSSLELRWLLNLSFFRKTQTTRFHLKFSRHQAKFSLHRRFRVLEKGLSNHGLLSNSVSSNVRIQNPYLYTSRWRLRVRIQNPTPRLFAPKSRPRYQPTRLRRRFVVNSKIALQRLDNLVLGPTPSWGVSRLRKPFEHCQVQKNVPRIFRAKKGPCRVIKVPRWSNFTKELYRRKLYRNVGIDYYEGVGGLYILRSSVFMRLLHLTNLIKNSGLNNPHHVGDSWRGVLRVDGTVETLSELARASINSQQGVVKHFFKQYLLGRIIPLYLQGFKNSKPGLLNKPRNWLSHVVRGWNSLLKERLSPSDVYGLPILRGSTLTCRGLTLRLETWEGCEGLITSLLQAHQLSSPTISQTPIVTPDTDNLLKLNLLLQCRRGKGWDGSRINTLSSLRTLFLDPTLWKDFLDYSDLGVIRVRYPHHSIKSSSLEAVKAWSGGKRLLTLFRRWHMLLPRYKLLCGTLVKNFLEEIKTIMFIKLKRPLGATPEWVQKRLKRRKTWRSFKKRFFKTSKLSNSRYPAAKKEFSSWRSVVGLFLALQIKGLVCRGQGSPQFLRRLILGYLQSKQVLRNVIPDHGDGSVKALLQSTFLNSPVFLGWVQGLVLDDYNNTPTTPSLLGRNRTTPTSCTIGKSIMGVLGDCGGNPLDSGHDLIIAAQNNLPPYNSRFKGHLSQNLDQGYTITTQTCNPPFLFFWESWGTHLHFGNDSRFETVLKRSLLEAEGFQEKQRRFCWANPDFTNVVTAFTNLLDQKFDHGEAINTSRSYFGRMFLSSRYELPFIFSSVGFLFLSSNDTELLVNDVYRQDKSMVIARASKHRLSFFEKNDLKRIYLKKPGFLKLVKSFFSSDSLFDTHYTILNHLKAPGLGLGCRSKNIANQYLGKSPRTKQRAQEVLRSSPGGGTGPERIYPILSIRRVRFRPGYQRMWRKARSAINYTLGYNCRYQVGLTKRLARVRRSNNYLRGLARDVTLLNVLIYSQFVFDVPTSKHLLQSSLVYVNGSSTSNQSLTLFVGDFLQLEVNLRYYITYRWLISWNKRHSLKFKKLQNYKQNNTSRSDLSKKVSHLLPDWIFFIGYKRTDIPNYLEVDFFTLSSFVIYRPLYLIDRNAFNSFEDRSGIHDMYNWKFI